MDRGVRCGLRSHFGLRDRHWLMVVRDPGVHLGGDRPSTIPLDKLRDAARTANVLERVEVLLDIGCGVDVGDTFTYPAPNFERKRLDTVRVAVVGREMLSLPTGTADCLRVEEKVDGVPGKTELWLDAEGISAAYADLSDAPPQREDTAAHGLVASRMHGLLVRLEVAVGQRVRKGEFMLAIEAMKMEHRIESPIDGTVVEVGAAAGAQVAPGQLLLRIEADA